MPHVHGVVGRDVADEHARQPDPARQAEQVGDARPAQVGVHQQDRLAALGQRDRQVGSGGRLALRRDGPGDDQAGEATVDGQEADVRAQLPVGLRPRREPVAGDQRGGRAERVVRHGTQDDGAGQGHDLGPVADAAVQAVAQDRRADAQAEPDEQPEGQVQRDARGGGHGGGDGGAGQRHDHRGRVRRPGARRRLQAVDQPGELQRHGVGDVPGPQRRGVPDGDVEQHSVERAARADGVGERLGGRGQAELPDHRLQHGGAVDQVGVGLDPLLHERAALAQLADVGGRTRRDEQLAAGLVDRGLPPADGGRGEHACRGQESHGDPPRAEKSEVVGDRHRRAFPLEGRRSLYVSYL